MIELVNLSIGLFLIIMGLILFGIEIAHPGVFLLIPASIVLAAGLLYLFLPGILLDTYYGPAIVIAAAFVAALATIPYYQRIAPIHRPMSTTAQSLEGEEGLLIADVVPDTLRGKVRVRSEVWSARANYPIPAGTKVKVLSGEGVSLYVEPIASSSGPTGGS